MAGPTNLDLARRLDEMLAWMKRMDEDGGKHGVAVNGRVGALEDKVSKIDKWIEAAQKNRVVWLQTALMSLMTLLLGWLVSRG